MTGIRKPGSRWLWYPVKRAPLPPDWRARIDADAQASGSFEPLLISVAIAALIALVAW